MKKKRSKELTIKINALISQFEKNHISVRFEKGRFKSSLCIVNNERVLMVNKLLDQNQTIDFLESILRNEENVLQAS